MFERMTYVFAIQYLLTKNRWIDIISSGSSMYPLIMDGDICRFVPLHPGEKLRKGDIVLYISDQEQLIGHRYLTSFVQNGAHYCLLKGDTNRLADPPIKATQLLGKLHSIKKKRFQLSSRHVIPIIWNFIVIRMPSFPVYCKQYLKDRQYA